MYPPDDEFLVYQLFGLPISIRWYAVCILTGVLVAGVLGARRAKDRGYNPDRVWDGLMLGLVLGVLGARLWYVASAWKAFEGKSLLYILNPGGGGGGLAIHGALLGAAITVIIYTRIYKLNVLDWFDIAAPCFAIAQFIGRWGNFFNQEAYGRAMEQPRPWGLKIDADHRVEQYQNLSAFPVETTRFHPTFLYEGLWNLLVFTGLLTVEKRFGSKLRRGDTALLYGIFYSIGRFFVEDLRVDKLCTGGAGGIICEEGLSTARLTSVVLIVVCTLIFIGRRLINRNPPASAYQPLGTGWPPAPESAASDEADEPTPMRPAGEEHREEQQPASS